MTVCRRAWWYRRPCVRPDAGCASPSPPVIGCEASELVVRAADPLRLGGPHVVLPRQVIEDLHRTLETLMVPLGLAGVGPTLLTDDSVVSQVRDQLDCLVARGDPVSATRFYSPRTAIPSFPTFAAPPPCGRQVARRRSWVLVLVRNPNPPGGVSIMLQFKAPWATSLEDSLYKFSVNEQQHEAMEDLAGNNSNDVTIGHPSRRPSRWTSHRRYEYCRR